MTFNDFNGFEWFLFAVSNFNDFEFNWSIYIYFLFLLHSIVVVHRGDQPMSNACDCHYLSDSANCHAGWAQAFENAFGRGSLCKNEGDWGSWCYTSLQCEDAPGLGLSDKGKCKYRDAEGDVCKPSSSVCVTTGTACVGAGHPCASPFTYEGVVYHECTSIYWNSAWCGTSHGWYDCAASCPMYWPPRLNCHLFQLLRAK